MSESKNGARPPQGAWFISAGFLGQLGKRDHQGEAECRGDKQGGVEHDRCPFVSPLTKIMQFGCQFRLKLNPPDDGDEGEYPKRHRHEFGIIAV